MHDAIAYSESTMDLLEDSEPPSVEELGERIYTAHNMFKGVFVLPTSHYTVIQLRAGMECSTTVHDSVLTKWLKELDTQKAEACMTAQVGKRQDLRIFVIVTEWRAKASLRRCASLEVHKLQGGSKVRRRWAVCKQAGGCGREEQGRPSAFLVLATSKVALRAHELASRVLDKDLDDWHLDRRWFKWTGRKWYQCEIDRFASELSAQWSELCGSV
eukprot:gene34355-biopygen26797